MSWCSVLFVWKKFRQEKQIGSVEEIMIVSILKNLNHIYYSHYIIKFIDFMFIYYVMNLNIVSLFMIFNNLYLGYIDLLQV